MNGCPGCGTKVLEPLVVKLGDAMIISIVQGQELRFINDQNYIEALNFDFPSELFVEADNFVDYTEIGERNRQQLNSFVTRTNDMVGHKDYKHDHFVAVTMDEARLNWTEVNCTPPRAMPIT